MKKGRVVPDVQQPTNVPLPMEPHERWLSLDDRTIGVHYWAWFIDLVLGKWGVDLKEEFSKKNVEQVLADHSTLFHDLPSAALDLDQDDVEGVLLEKAAKLCARGEITSAGRLVRGFIENRVDHGRAKSEVDAGKARQRKKSQLPRPTPLIKIVASTYAQKSDISVSELLVRIEAAEEDGTIEYVKNGVIGWRDKNDKLKKSKVSGLKDMLYREKRRKMKAICKKHHDAQYSRAAIDACITEQLATWLEGRSDLERRCSLYSLDASCWANLSP